MDQRFENLNGENTVVLLVPKGNSCMVEVLTSFELHFYKRVINPDSLQRKTRVEGQFVQ